MNQFAEQAVAGSLLISPQCIGVIRPILTAGDFASAPCAAIFRAVCRLSDSGAVIDPVVIQADAAKHGEDLPTDYLMQLMEITPTAANVQTYAAVVHDNAIRRAVTEAAEATIEAAKDASIDTAKLLSDAVERVQRIDAGQAVALASSEDAAAEFLSYRDTLESGGAAVVSTGFAKLDKLLGGGMLKSGLYICAARPGVGKTTLGLKIADRASRRVPVLFVSLEMDLEQLTARRIAERSRLSIRRVLMGESLTGEEMEKLTLAAVEMAETKLFINRSASATVEEIALIAHSIGGLGMIVIDYLGLISSKDKGSLYERVTANSNALKKLARSMKTPVLCLSQLNRQSEQRQDKRPTMGDLRDSGAIEQDADAVILLHRPMLYEPQDKRPKPTEAEPLEIIIAKNRHGQTGNLTYSLYGATGIVAE